MPKIITAIEAKSRLGDLVKWTAETQDAVIVTRFGQPAVVIISYAAYENMQKLRKREHKQKVLEALNRLRLEARRQNPDLSAEEAYRLAGFSQEVIQDILQADQALATLKP